MVGCWLVYVEEIGHAESPFSGCQPSVRWSSQFGSELD